MAKQDYPIAFDNGSSTGPVMLPVGTYTFVSSTIPGYESGSTMDFFEITHDTVAVTLAITAGGTLTVTVEDDLGTKITSGQLFLSDSSGAMQFGVPQNLNNGVATFNHVPYSTASTVQCYVMQNGSDLSHDPITTAEGVLMNSSSVTDTIENPRKNVVIGFNIDDATYTGMIPGSGTIVING